MGSIRALVGFALAESDKDGGDGGVRRWDLLLRVQPAPR